MKVLNLVVAIWKLVAKYPALTAGVFNVIIIAAAQVGLTLTTPQLASLAGTVAAVFAVLVHAGVIPVTKVENVKAGVKPSITTPVVVADVHAAVVDPEPVEDLTPTPTVPSPVTVADVFSEPATVTPPDQSKLGHPISVRKVK